MTRPDDTRVTLSQLMTAAETNLLGTIHGGDVMKLVDSAAGVVGARFAGGQVVTAAMDEMVFVTPVRVGDVLHVSAQANWAGRSSVEVGARVETERWDELTERVHVATAYVVMVAVDDEGRPRAVPALDPVSDQERRRHREAGIRRQHRLARRADILASRQE